MITSSSSCCYDPPSRAALRSARRVCVKAGTSVVANEDGRPSLTRLGAICEQIAELNRSGVEVIFVSSGAVGMGKRVLRKQSKLNMSFMDMNRDDSVRIAEEGLNLNRNSSFASLLHLNAIPHTASEKKKFYDSACAAAGQFEMMNLYSSLFDQGDVAASQILVTQSDFIDEKRKQNLVYTVERLLTLGVVPIINENDAVSANQGYTSDDIFSDNDSLAALCARSFGAEVLVLLTDVAGVFESSPKENPDAKLLPLYLTTSEVKIGTKSSQGRGGMASKIEAATSAVQPGSKCTACVVAAGSDLYSIRAILGNDPKYGIKGTMFVTPGSELEKQAIADFHTQTVSVTYRNVQSKSRQEIIYTLQIYRTMMSRKKHVVWRWQHERKLGNFKHYLTKCEKIFSMPLQTH
jgi:delta-1-pyrroline-5-carboxylate synthetase